MPAHDGAAQRDIQLEIDVPGSADAVWKAIATGPGITAWFVPATVEERQGGRMLLQFGPGIDEAGEVTVWDPPRRFAYGSPGDEGKLVYEFLVVPRDEAECTVRLINGGFGVGAEWDTQRDLMEGGWRLFLSNLRLYLTHFPGQPCSPLLITGHAAGPVPSAWEALRARLELGFPALGDRVAVAGAGVPSLGGVVERAADGMLTLRLDEPAPGIAFLAAEGEGTDVYISLYVYLFGDSAPEAAAQLEPAWRAWMQSNFPLPDQDAPDVNAAR